MVVRKSVDVARPSQSLSFDFVAGIADPFNLSICSYSVFLVLRSWEWLYIFLKILLSKLLSVIHHYSGFLCSALQIYNHATSRHSVGKVLKSEKYHPYKIKLLQELSDDNFDRRLEFYELIDIYNVDEHFSSNVVFCNEVTFCYNAGSRFS